MRATWLIARRELGAYLKSPLGYVVGAAILFVGGLLFNGFALQQSQMLSSEVLRRFFYFWSGMVMTASVFLTMRLFAEERATGTLVLLQTAPIKEWEIVGGKFLSAFAILAALSALSIYMPLLIMLEGRVSLGQLAAGYVGILALAAATTAMGTFASSLVKSQVLAAVLSGALIVGFLVCWMVADKADPPFAEALHYLAMWDKHFYPTFTRGVVRLADVVFFVMLSGIFLLLTTKVLQMRRWVG